MKSSKEQDNISKEKNIEEELSVNELGEISESENTDLETPSSEENKITKLTEELESQKDKYVRLFAEFDNFKRRSAKERMELIQTAGREVIISMLDVLDDGDRAEKQMSNDNLDQVKTGVLLVFNKLRNSLQARGLKQMESLNTDFDVEKHEAIAEVPVDDENKKGKVIDEIVKGYYLNDKLIRFAKVIVGK